MAPDTAPEITRLSSFSTPLPLAPRDLERGSSYYPLRHLDELVTGEWHPDRIVAAVGLDEGAARRPELVARREGDRPDHVLQPVLEVLVRDPQEPLRGQVLPRLLEHVDEQIGGQVTREHRLRQHLVGLDGMDFVDDLLHRRVALLCRFERVELDEY